MAGARGRTRERIKEAALDLFGEQGYGTTTLQHIADRLELTKAALYYYYRTKDDLLEDLTTAFVDDFEGVVVRAEGRPRTPSAVRQALAELIDLYLANRRTTAVLSYDKTLLGHPVGERVSELSQRLLDVVAGPDRDVRQTVRGAAALGAVFVPVVELDERTAPSDEIAEPLLAAACAVLGIRQAARQTTRATGG
ncbi:TetR/AcrR family transcriptional regulator [Streptomyces sp. NPDC012935]|uniref:TetR/AcrR family transcriptional regulator n=1 Tax=Streptomyces sp. NPDC012935 TaxID=3364857 RepID=UPI0036832965